MQVRSPRYQHVIAIYLLNEGPGLCFSIPLHYFLGTRKAGSHNSGLGMDIEIEYFVVIHSPNVQNHKCRIDILV